MTIFFRLLDCEDKATALLEQVRSPDGTRGRQRFEVNPADFASVPRSPFAYWASHRLRRLFAELPPFEADGRTAKVGLLTTDDTRFVRVWWEVPPASVRTRWFPFAKGGASSRFYEKTPMCVDWWQQGSQTWAIYQSHRAVAGGMAKNADYYFRPGVTWPLRASKFCPQALPAGCIFSLRSYCAFVLQEDLPSTLAILSSTVFDHLFKTTLGRYGFPEFVVGVLDGLPWQAPRNEIERSKLGGLARRGWSLKRSLDTPDETAHAFTLPALLQVEANTLAERSATWVQRVHVVEAELATIQAQIDGACFDLYDIDDAERCAIMDGVGPLGDTAHDCATRSDAEIGGETENDAEDTNEKAADASTLTSELLSWAMGVPFGRFDVRLATGDRPSPPEPEPFDPLPVCSPGMLNTDDGLPLSRAPAGYPLAFPENGLLVDDAGHSRDLCAALRSVFEIVFGMNSDARWHEAADLLDPQNRDLRRWLARIFFEQHLKRYSKSRRKAPIFWQLATPSASYSVWLYAHRLTKDSFYQLQNDLVAPKLAHEERKLASLTQAAGDSPTASQRKEIAAQEAFVEELRTLRDEVARIAPLWDPDLNDGVVITAAPLWRLVPQHKPWQKELQTVWDALCAGKYDWAHLSLHLWPERVVPKCADDRSLAIAHELEDMLWVEDDNTWRELTEPKQEIDQQKRPRDKDAYRRLRDGLATLADRADAPLAAAELWRQLEAGTLDESLAALCLWPRRVLELCTADPDLARRLEVKLPPKRTKAALDKLVKQYETGGYGELLDTVRAALAERSEPFRDLWQQLADGHLDDLPLALVLWPERVVDRCTEDRELAGRHNLARYFWYHEPAGDWRRRKSPHQEVIDEVARRHNPTVKAALQSLLDAGSPAGTKGARKRRK